jgi:uncharacterized membrane protein
MEKHIRTFWKSVSWRILATSTTFIIVTITTGNLVIGASVCSLEAVAKSIIYYFHERLWNTTNFGRINSSYNKEKSEIAITTNNRRTNKNRKNAQK